MKGRWTTVALMAMIVCLAGEFKFFPYQNDFRISLAPTAFFFCLLWIRRVHPLLSGMVTAVSVLIFRIVMDTLIWHRMTLDESFAVHYPSFFYYATFVVLFALLRMRRYRHRPLVIGLMAVAVELTANASELLFRYPAALSGVVLPGINEVVLIAIFRSFFVIGLYSIAQKREQQAAEKLRQRQYESMVLLISSLYEEAIQLSKTMQQAEHITRDSYALYRELKAEASLQDNDKLAQTALRIAGQVHEIKKDNQRIHAGLSHIISSESIAETMTLPKLCGIVVKSNRKYAVMLGKSIDFKLQIDGDHPPYRLYTLLSLLNNLVTNAVEAIAGSGEIAILARREGDWLLVDIADDGPGIPPAIRNTVFVPGFTTKYDAAGKPSTGIGLYYVREIAVQLHGEINVRSRPGQTGAAFRLRLPIASLINGISGE